MKDNDEFKYDLCELAHEISIDLDVKYISISGNPILFYQENVENLLGLALNLNGSIVYDSVIGQQRVSNLKKNKKPYTELEEKIESLVKIFRERGVKIIEGVSLEQAKKIKVE